MGLLIECPECKRRNSLKGWICKCGKCRDCLGRCNCGKCSGCKKRKSKVVCKCGFVLSKFSGKVYWIEWYQDGQRRRERIGPSKAAAEERLRKIKSALVEGRHIRKSPEAKVRFQDLAQWYLALPEVTAKKSYRRDNLSVKCLTRFFGSYLLKDMSPALVEKYKQDRLSEISRHKQPLKPAIINRELACLKTIFNKAMKNGKAERNPAQGVKLHKENNERDRVLTPEEFTRLLVACPSHLKPVVKLAYHTGMRQGEILNLTWGQVDMKEGFIRLYPEYTKTNEGRLVPLNREMMDMFQTMPRGLPGLSVFNLREFPRDAFITACKKARIENFTFHDLRHTYINNRRLEGHDYFRIMAATGHKTMSVFKRYNTVSKEELKTLAGKKI